MRAARTAARAGVVVLVVTGLVASVVVVVKASDGAFASTYQVVGMFPAAGQGLHPGSQVDYDGVQVGRVESIALRHRRARVVLDMQPSFRFPADATATIRPLNLFGAEEVAVDAPAGKGPPWLKAGATIRHTAVSSQIADLFATADPLLERIDTTDLSSAIGELNQATNGQGAQIANGLGQGSHLASLLSSTLSAQLHALDSFAAFTGAVAPDGAALNDLAGAANASLPTINRSERAFQRLLETLTPLSEHVAQFLAAYRPNIGALLRTGDNVTRVLVSHEQDIEALVHGLYVYVTKIAAAASHAQTLPDGSKFAYFRTFIEFSDVNNLVCNLIAPAAPGLAALEPLQQALGSSGSPFDCSAEVKTFDSLQGAGPPSTPATAPGVPTVPTGTPGGPSASSASVAREGQQVAGQIYAAVGSPQTPQPHSLQSYVSMLTGAL